ncbi:MAG: flagellar basal body rod protein FlgB [Armatimonadota bacterium]|nr:flagellar basal body rod protein FlgB [Armatimonadota bacterium]
MDTSTITALSQALDLGSARLQAISNNLSNVNTPGFKRQDATFAALLHSAEAGGDLSQETTDPRHMTLDDGSDSPTLVTQRNGSMRADGNNVDIDAETSRMAAAEIYYEGASQLISGQFAAMKYVISGGR